MKNNKKMLLVFLGLVFIVLLLLCGLKSGIFDMSKDYLVKIVKYDNSEVAIVKNTSSNIFDFSLKTIFTDNTSLQDSSKYLMPNEETVLFIKNENTKKVDDYSISSSVKDNVELFSNYEMDTNIDVIKSEVTVKLTKNSSIQSIEGEIIVYFYNDKKEIIDIKKNNLDFSKESIEWVVESNKKFKEAKIIDRFWKN